MHYRDYGLISVLFLRTILPFKVDSRIYSAKLRGIEIDGEKNQSQVG